MVGAAIALVADVVMQNALNAVRVTGRDIGPWWAVGRVVERGTFLAAAVLAWLTAPLLSLGLGQTFGHQRGTISREAAWSLVGYALIVGPIVWTVATWTGWAFRIAAIGSWQSEGRVFVSASYYGGLLVWYLPWLLAGVLLRRFSVHASVG
jgi:hypothetical protein